MWSLNPCANICPTRTSSSLQLCMAKAVRTTSLARSVSISLRIDSSAIPNAKIKLLVPFPLSDFSLIIVRLETAASEKRTEVQWWSLEMLILDTLMVCENFTASERSSTYKQKHLLSSFDCSTMSWIPESVSDDMPWLVAKEKRRRGKNDYMRRYM